MRPCVHVGVALGQSAHVACVARAVPRAGTDAVEAPTGLICHVRGRALSCTSVPRRGPPAHGHARWRPRHRTGVPRSILIVIPATGHADPVLDNLVYKSMLLGDAP